MQTKHTAYYS